MRSYSAVLLLFAAGCMCQARAAGGQGCKPGPGDVLGCYNGDGSKVIDDFEGIWVCSDCCTEDGKELLDASGNGICFPDDPCTDPKSQACKDWLLDNNPCQLSKTIPKCQEWMASNPCSVDWIDYSQQCSDWMGGGSGGGGNGCMYRDPRTGRCYSYLPCETNPDSEECRQQQNCSCSESVDEPVCSTNGTVFKNKCSSDCQKAKVRWKCGKRSQAACANECAAAAAGGDGGGCTCSAANAPVCSKEGKVFTNSCKAQCARAGVRWRCGWRSSGRCKEDCLEAANQSTWNGCSCSKAFSPVCATNGKVYSNNCYAKCKGATKRFQCGLLRDCEGDCKALTKPGCSCHPSYAPVCGKNGKLYDNGCFAKCDQSGKRFACGKNLRRCAKECKCGCDQSRAPVCTSSGRVFANECLAKCAKSKVLWKCGWRTDCEGQCQKQDSSKGASSSRGGNGSSSGGGSWGGSRG